MKITVFSYKSLRSNSGVTLIEMIVTIGILSTLLAIGLLSVTNLPANTTINTDITLLISDIKNQQIKAMVGDTGGRDEPDNYGIKIYNDRYVLFNGYEFDENSPDNQEIPISSVEQLSTTFPDTSIIFASASGEIINFVDGQNSVSVINTQSSQSKTVELNKYGTIISTQ